MSNVITIYGGDAKVTYSDTTETKELLFQKLLEFFKTTETFSGESVCQSDRAIIAAPELLSDIADEIFKFDIKYTDD